jgi:hypothetical protein
MKLKISKLKETYDSLVELPHESLLSVRVRREDSSCRIEVRGGRRGVGFPHCDGEQSIVGDGVGGGVGETERERTLSRISREVQALFM